MAVRIRDTLHLSIQQLQLCSSQGSQADVGQAASDISAAIPQHAAAVKAPAPPVESVSASSQHHSSKQTHDKALRLNRGGLMLVLAFLVALVAAIVVAWTGLQ